MSLVSTPEKDGSIWSSAHNNALFTFQREDYVVNTVVNDGTGKLRVVGVSLDANVAVGEFVYINSGVGVYSHAGKVSFVNIPGNTFDVDINFISNTAGGYMNTGGRSSYRLRLDLTNSSTGEIREVSYTNDFTGLIKADVGDIILNWMEFKDNFTTQVDTSEIDDGKSINYSAQFFVDFRNLDGTTSAGLPTAIPGTFYGVMSAKPIGDTNNGNLVGDLLNSATPPTFLTAFTQPVHWKGLPFTVSFPWDSVDDDVETLEISRGVRQKDINKSFVLAEQIDALSGGFGTISKLTMASITFDATTRNLDIWIETAGAAIPLDYVDPGYVDPDYVT